MEPQTPLVEIPFAIRTEDGELRARLKASPEPMPLTQILPAARALDDALIGMTLSAQERLGAPLACTRGCDACCRQLVPVSPVEAFALLDVVEALPEPRRGEVERRFAEARARASAAGLDERIEGAMTGAPVSVAPDYFRLGIPCPLLGDDGACSIYQDRPFACREYCVSSDPAFCAGLGETDIHPIIMPLCVTNAVGKVARHAWPGVPRRMPMIWALDWAREHADLRDLGAPGTDLLMALLSVLQQGSTPPGQDSETAPQARLSPAEGG